MKVMKFGGTSVGTVERIKELKNLIVDGQQKIVVLSAMAGTTNALVEISDYLYKGNPEGANALINKLRLLYIKHVDALYSQEANKQRVLALLEEIFLKLREIATQPFSEVEEKVVLAQGELMSTNMVTAYLQECGVSATLIPALDFMRTDINGEPNMFYLKEHIDTILKADPNKEIYITQGFICMTHDGFVSNLQRGGSDYTASLIGAALKADEIQIWTDIDGMHNNDPRIVEGTKPVRQLSFDEAAELAYFGAKILHPTCVQPARYMGVPVRLLNTMEPDAPGTTISNQTEEGKIKAVAAKDNITAIKIVSSRMLLATGFLKKVFEVFENHKTSIDMVATSEVGVSLSIDNTSHLTQIVNELKTFSLVEVDENMCIICVVGDLRSKNIGFETKIMQAFADIPVRMISYGGSSHNVSFLVDANDKQRALQALSATLFVEKKNDKTK